MIIAIDPSINDVGCASVDRNGIYLSSTTLKSKGPHTVDKLASICEQLTLWIKDFKEINVIIIEHTRFFARQNNQSHASAQKLNLAKGALYGTCKALNIAPVHLIWIPGFNKEQAKLISRIHQLPNTMSQHELDAFWLAHHWHLAPAPQKQQLIESELV